MTVNEVTLVITAGSVNVYASITIPSGKSIAEVQGSVNTAFPTASAASEAFGDGISVTSAPVVTATTLSAANEKTGAYAHEAHMHTYALYHNPLGLRHK